MRCNKLRKNLTAFLDGELSDGLAARIEEHLADCAVCQAERKALAGVRLAVEGMSDPTLVPPVTADAILDRAGFVSRDSRDRTRRREDARERRFLPVPIGWRPAVALAMGLMIIGLWKVIPILKSLPLPTHQEIHMVERMELFENLELIKELSLVEGLGAEEGHNGELS